MWMGLIQSIEGLNKTKRLSKREFALTVFELGHQSSTTCGLRLGLEVYTTGSPIPQSFELRLELYHRSPGCPACQLQILGLLSLHNCMSQFFVINTFVSLNLDICYWLCFS